jgi:hypothetical protein
LPAVAQRGERLRAEYRSPNGLLSAARGVASKVAKVGGFLQHIGALAGACLMAARGEQVCGRKKKVDQKK